VARQRQLLGDASHELPSPLARLTVALSMARKRPAEESSEHLQRITVETQRLDKLVGQLLTLSRIDSRVDAGRGTRVDLANLILEVASDGDFEARPASGHVVVTSAAPCAVLGSEEDLRSAVENVVRNAIRYTRKGTTVEISLDRQEESGGATAILRVRDHGAGVPEEMLAEVFLPFRRVGPDTEGAGLGLAITERAVSVHGGTVRATNALDGGLVVEIKLPSCES
jgi:two-component system sensor histidine kinase CpxA